MSQTLFVGREQELTLYHNFLMQKTPWVLIITGMGGVGKSALLDHFAANISFDTLAVSLDFNREPLRVDSLHILEELASQTASHCGEKEVEEFKHTLQEGRREKLSNQLKEMLITVNTTHSETRSGMLEFETRAIREIHLQIRRQLMEVLYEQIHTFDMARLILLLDTCEWLSEPQNGEVGQWLMDELLPELHHRMARNQQQCSVVIASRLQPSLKVIRKKDQLQFALPMLNQEEMAQYLQYIGMQNTQLRQQVYSLTYGHPLCLSIIGTIWQERGEQTFTLADLPKLTGDFNEHALHEFIRGRLDKDLTFPFRELTHYGVVLRSFNLPLLQTVFLELLPDAEAFETFHQFTRYPYIKALGNHRYAFHELLREIQATHIREHEPEAWAKYHKRALDYLTQTDLHSTDWYYHALAFDQQQAKAMNEWLQTWQTAKIRGAREQIGALLQVAYDITLKLTPAACAWRAYMQGLSYYHDLRLDKALESYGQALALFREGGDHLGEANVLQAMGDVQQFHKNLQPALAHYEHALALFQQVEDRLGEANARKAIGDVQQFRNEHESALASYEQALFLYRQVGDHLGEANVLQAMGDIQQFRKNMQDAVAHYEHALRLFQHVGNRLGEANVLKAIGDIQQFHKDLPTALTYYEQALSLFQQLGNGIGEANVLQAIGDVRWFYDEHEAALQSYGQALILFQRVGDRLGEAHVRQAIGDVRQLLYQQQAALDNYERALFLYQQVGDRLGEAHARQAIGDVQQFRDGQEAASKSYEQALFLFHQIGDSLGEANCYLAQGQVALRQEQYQQALSLHNKAYEIYHSIQDDYSQARLLYYRSFVYEAMNNRPYALENVEEALKIAKRLDLPIVELFQQRFDSLHQLSS